MTIERDVLVRMRVERGRDGAAFAEVAKDAKKADVEVKRVGASVAAMVREMAKTRETEKHLERVTKQLQTMGVAADKARVAATRLLKDVGDGARITEQHVRNLATGMKTLGQAGGGGGGFLSRMRGQFSGGGLGGMGLSALGPTALAGAGIMALGRGFSASFSTTGDDLVRQNTQQQGSRWERFASSVHDGIPIFQQVRDYFTSNAREQAAESQRRLERAEATRQRQRQVRATGEAQLAAEAQQQAGINDLAASTRIAAQTAPMAGLETANLRIRGLRQQHVMAGDLVTREGQVTRELNFDAARQEIANRPQTGGAALAQVDAERQHLLQQVAEARRIGQAAQGTFTASDTQGGGTVNLDRERESAQRMEELQRRLLEVEQRRNQVVRERSAAERQYFDEWRTWAAQAEQNYRTLAEQERARIGQRRESFGQMDETQRQELLQVSRAIRGGQQLTFEQEDVVLRNREMFGDRARQIGERRGQQFGFEEFQQNVGMDAGVRDNERRAREAGRLRAQMDQTINQDLTTGEADRERQGRQRELDQVERMRLAQRERQLIEREAALGQGGGLAVPEAERERIRQQMNAMLAGQATGAALGLTPATGAAAGGGQPPAVQALDNAATALTNVTTALTNQQAPLASGPGALVGQVVQQMQQQVATGGGGNEALALLRELIAEVRQLRERGNELSVDFQTDIQAELNMQADSIAQEIAEQLLPKVREATVAMVAELRQEIERFLREQQFNQVF